MKLRIEIADDLPDEVVIRCKSVTDEVRRLQTAIASVAGGAESISLTRGDKEFYIPIRDILFFETDGEHVAAHTAAGMYKSDRKLYELERLLPSCFMRVSKSCILDSAKVASVSKNITGIGEVLFYGSDKKAYVSRLYCKALRDLIFETRLKS